MLEVGICVGCWGFCEESATRMFLGPNERTMHRGFGGQTQLFSVTMYVLSTDRTFGTPPSSGRSFGPAPSPTHPHTPRWVWQTSRQHESKQCNYLL